MGVVVAEEGPRTLPNKLLVLLFLAVLFMPVAVVAVVVFEV